MITETVLWALISMGAGALITFGVSWLIYKRSGDQLAEEAARLRKLQELTLYCLVNQPEGVKVKYGEDGSVQGLIVGGSMSATFPSFEASGTLTQASPDTNS